MSAPTLKTARLLCGCGAKLVIIIRFSKLQKNTLDSYAITALSFKAHSSHVLKSRHVS